MDRKKKAYARERSVTVAFRMSEDAARRLDALVSPSGLTKQEYIERRLTNQSVTVYPSSRIGERSHVGCSRSIASYSSHVRKGAYSMRISSG